MKNFRAVFLLPALFLLPFAPVHAAHLLGGHWSYECLGGNDFRFRLVMFRDCAGTGALFDSAPNSPFAGTVSVYMGENPDEYENIVLPPPLIEPVSTTGDCFFAGLCIEKGTYVFEMTLPETDEAFHFSYQRCCISDGISNIVNPGSTGITYTIEVSPEARAACNNSPVFGAPFFTCSEAMGPLSFDHSATDVDGDELVYEFCAPFDGGGTDQMNFEDPDGVAPNPDLPPPYDEAVFTAPFYSPEMPIHGSPAIVIDPATGLISGTPDLTGKYLYAVCVSEFRMGVLMSKTRFVLQHQSAVATPVLEAPQNAPVTVFPNPATDVLKIELPDSPSPYGLEILAADGHIVWSRQNAPGGSLEIPTGNLPEGVYLLRATQADVDLSVRWVKL